jgi:hypothetical protein
LPPSAPKWMWHNDKAWTRIQWIMGILGLIGMGVSLYLAKFGFGLGFDKDNPFKFWQALTLSFWVLVPPIWFWVEYFFLFKRTPTSDRGEFDEFKHGQDQAAKIWLALITVLLGLYFGKDLTRESTPSKTNATQQISSPPQNQPQAQPPTQSPPASGAPPEKTPPAEPRR